MGDVIKVDFDKKKYTEDIAESDRQLGEKIDRIRSSIKRINELMTELRGVKKETS